MRPAIAIRPMTVADVRPAADAIVRGGWGDREAFFRWAVGHAGCRPFVAEADGRVVGTGVASAHGRVGWVGTIFVAPDLRGDGLGRRLTRQVIDDLEERGCRTLVLIATELGRPLYERLGFEVLSEQRRLSTTGASDDEPVPGVRPFDAADLAAVVALDREATGEDRSAVLASLATPGTATVVVRDDRAIGGFIVRGPWGGNATVAADPDEALRLLEWRRRRAAPDATVAAGLLRENVVGRARLVDEGWVEEAGPVRMIRGEPLAWRPDAIWGQFNGALG